MANATIPLFSFYQRYLWGPTDFEEFQDAVVDLVRGPWGSALAASLASGGAITPNGANASVNVAAFVAIGDDGYMHVKTTNTVVPIAAGHATLNRYDLIVARANLVVASSIARPTPPGDSVTLKTSQETQLVVIQGTPGSSPSVPSKVGGDVILGSVYVPAAWVNTVSSGNINQTTHHEIGNFVRFASSAKNVSITARSGNTTAGTYVGSGSGSGLSGTAGSTGSGWGVYGEAGSGAGTIGLGPPGAAGVGGAGRGAAPGVYGVSGDAVNGAGVKGESFNAGSPGVHGSGFDTGDGVYGENTSGSNGAGVHGLSFGGRGVIAEGDTTTPLRAAFRIVPQDAQPSGASLVGDIYVTTAGVPYICTTAGTPGTWTKISAT